MLLRTTAIISFLAISACTEVEQPTASICTQKVLCGFFSISKVKESTPIFFAIDKASPVYRMCVLKGSVLLQTLEADGNAKSIGGEILEGNCTEISFSQKVYIIGNTMDGPSEGFYYRVP